MRDAGGVAFTDGLADGLMALTGRFFCSIRVMHINGVDFIPRSRFGISFSLC